MTKQWAQYQANLFLLAVSFFSRLPVTSYVIYTPSKMRRASQYFPLVGGLLALILVCCYQIFMMLFGILPAIILVMIASMLLTGALHEDGLADVCDGVWGGYSRERKLSIMKDSRIGTYGTCALVLMFLLKASVWWELANQEQLILGLFVAYPLSRALAISLVQDMAYVSNHVPSSGSKSEPLAKPMPAARLAFVIGSGAIAVFWLPISTVFSLLVGCLLFRFALKHWLNKHLGGYTGDALGTAQQLQELLIYLIILANLGRIG